MRSRRAFGFLLLLAFFSALLWWAILYHRDINERTALNTFLQAQHVLVERGAASAQAWVSTDEPLTPSQWLDQQGVESNPFELIIRPLQLLGTSDAWLFVNGKLAYEKGSLFPKAFIDQSAREIFHQHRSQGASNFGRLLRGLSQGNQDSGWFVLTEARGREYASWDSVSVGDDIWTIGISTREREILSAFLPEQRYIREATVGTVGTLLIFLFLVLALRLDIRNFSIITQLRKEVADRAQIEIALRESDNRYKRLFMDSKAVQLILDQRTAEIVDANGAASRYYGYSHEKLKTMKMTALMPLSPEQITSEMLRSRAENRAYLLLKHRLSTGEIRDVEVYSSGLRVRNRNLVYAIVHDVTDRRRMEQQIKHLGNHDALTGLPNRALLVDRLEVAIEQAKRVSSTLAVLFIDLDDFKPINDRLGHSAGDELLTLIAQRFQTAIRRSDTVARFGGDEFVLLLSGGDLDETTAAQVAEKTFRALQKPFSVEGHKIKVGCSIGISLYPRDGSTVEALISEADRAMYAAKQSGTNHYRFVTDSDSEEHMDA